MSTPGDHPTAPRGPGPPGAAGPNGHRPPDGARDLAGGPQLASTDSPPGAALIGWAAWLLAPIGAGALYDSFAAQRQYVYAARHQDVAAIIEALLPDSLMIVFTLLALGLSWAGKSSRTERALVLACAIAAAYMNVSAADVHSPRSVAAYALPPIALAAVVDRVVAVIRRHVRAAAEDSAWTALGRALAATARAAVMVVLYLIRFMLDRRSTAAGLRRWVLASTPLPGPARAPDDLPRCLARIESGPGALCWSLLPCTEHRPGSDGPAPASRAALEPAEPAAAAGIPPGARVTAEVVAAHFAADLAAGRVPSGKAIRRLWHVGSGRAAEIHDLLAAQAAARQRAN